MRPRRGAPRSGVVLAVLGAALVAAIVLALSLTLRHRARGPGSFDDAFVSQDSVCVLDAQRRCIPWNPRATGRGAPVAPLTVVLAMQTADDLYAATDDTAGTVTVTLSGGDLALKACLSAFSFTIDPLTPDANGNAGLGGYYSSSGATYIPRGYAPASANYSALPLTLASAAPRAVPLFANFFTDGSLRVTGTQGVAIPPGTYHVNAACIVYLARPNPLAPPANVRVSDETCVSSIWPVLTAPSPVQVNYRTLVGNFYEYFPIDYYNGHLYVLGSENCYPESNAGAPFFQYAMLSSFYHLQYAPGAPAAPLERLSYIRAVDPSLDPLSSVVYHYYNRTMPTRVHAVYTNQQEAGLVVSRADPLKLAFVQASEQVPIYKGGWQFAFSVDGGLTWDVDSINITDAVGVPDSLVFYPPGFQNVSWTCSHNTATDAYHCPPDGGDDEIVTGWESFFNGNVPLSGGDNRMAVDALDQFWQVGLYWTGRYPDENHASVMVTMSPDQGRHWYKVADLGPADVTAFSYDYTVVAAGSNGRGGALFCVALKADATISELLTFGTTLPTEINCFETERVGRLGTTYRYAVPGTEPGHYGGLSIGADGAIYLVLQGMPGSLADLITGDVIGSSFGPYGSNNLYNAPILLTKCGIAGGRMQCSENATVIARVDTGLVCPDVQTYRCTWSHPAVAVDKNNVLYVFFVDAVRNPLPTADAYAAFVNVDQATRVLMIQSPDGGATWSAPQTINDDLADARDGFSTANVHFNLVAQYDPVTHSIAVAWLDTRVDPDTHTGVQVYATVVAL